MEESIVITSFQKLQLIVANLTNELLAAQTLISDYYSSNQARPILKLFAKEKDDPIESSYQSLWFQGVRSSPVFIEQLAIFTHLASPRHLTTAIYLLINWLPEKPPEVASKFIDGSINYYEYFALIKDEPRIFLKFVPTVVDMVVADSITHLMRYYNGENIDPELLHIVLPILVEYFHGTFKESRFSKNILTEELWEKLYESIQEQWRCIYGIVSYKFRGFKIEDVIRRAIIEKELRSRRLPMLKYLKNYENATNDEILSTWKCLTDCIGETKNQQAREALIEVFASVVSTADNSQREEAYQLIYQDSIKWAKNAPTHIASINLQCNLLAFGTPAFYDGNIDKLMEKILKYKPGPPSQTIRFFKCLLTLLRGKYIEFPYYWKVPDRIFFTPRSNFTRRNIQTPLKFECPYATPSLSLFPPKLKPRIALIFSLFGARSRLLKDIDICDELLALSTEILLQVCSQSAFFFSQFLDDVILNPRGDIKAKFAAISAAQRFLSNDTPLDFINSAFSLWNKPFNSELSGEFFIIKIRDSCFKEMNLLLSSPPEILSQTQTDQYIHPRLLFDPFSIICYDVTDEKQITTSHKLFELESSKRWRSHFSSFLLKDFNEETSNSSNRVNGILSNWCLSISNTLNQTITSLSSIPHRPVCPWTLSPKGRKTYSLFMKSIETLPFVIESAMNPESVINLFDCLYHFDLELVENCSKCIQEIFLRYPDLRIPILRSFVTNAKQQFSSINRARLMSQLLFILDLLSSLQRMEGVLITEQDALKIRSEIDLIVLLYLSDFSPLVRQLAIKVSKTAFSIWYYQPGLSIAHIMITNSEYILEVSRFRYLFALENKKRNILSKDKNFSNFPTIEEVAMSKHTAYWLYVMTTIANELYHQKFPLLHEASDLIAKYLEPLSEERLSIEKDMIIIVQRLLLLSLKNSISLVIDPSVNRIFLTNDEWRMEHFYLYISHANSQAMDDLVNLFHTWYTSMKKRELTKIFPRIIRFLRTISCENNFQKLVGDKKRDIVPKLTEIIIDITNEYIIPELNQNKFGNEEVFIDYSLLIYDLSSSLIIPTPYATFGPLRQSLTMIGIDDLWELKQREVIFHALVDWAFYDYSTETNKILANIKDLAKKEQKKQFFQNTKQTILRSCHTSVEALVKLNCFTDPPSMDTLNQLFLIETMDTNLRILHWLLAYHFDKLISIYLDKAYYFRDQHLEGKHYGTAIFNMYAPVPLKFILPTPVSFVQREIIMYSRIEEELANQQKNFSFSPLTTQDLSISASTQHKAAQLFIVASYHTISEDSEIREKAFFTLHRLIESNFGSITISNIKNNHNSNMHIFLAGGSQNSTLNSFRKTIIQYGNSPSIKECKFNAVQLSHIASKNSPHLTSCIFVEIFKRVPIIGSDDLKFWILRIIIPWCSNISLNNFNDFMTEELASAQIFLKNLFQSISIAINSAHRNLPTPVLRIWQALSASPSEEETKNVGIMTEFLFNRSFDLQSEDDPETIYTLCKSILISIYITPSFNNATRLIDKILFSEIYSSLMNQDNLLKKSLPISDDNLNFNPLDVHTRSLTLDILCSLCESNSFFMNLLSQIHIIFIWGLIRMNSSNSKDANISIHLTKNILLKFQQFFSTNESILVPEQLNFDLDRWILLLSCKTTFTKRKLLFPIDDLCSNNNNNNNINLSDSGSMSNTSFSKANSSENFNVKMSSISNTNNILMGDSLISTFMSCCSLISPNLTYLCARESLLWASYSFGTISTISYRIFKFAIENITPEISFEISIVHSLISNLLNSFSSMESSIANFNSKPTLPQYTLKTVPENQSICLEILNIFITISQKFIYRNNELYNFELHILFSVLYIVNSPLVFNFDPFIPIIAKCFELLLHMVVNGLFDRIQENDDFQAQFEAKFKKFRTNKFQGILPSLVKGVYISKLEVASVQLLRALIDTPITIHPLLYPSNHACMFLGLTPWIVSQLMLYGSSPLVLAYILCKEFSQKSNFEQIRLLSHLAISVNTNQFITNTCNTIIPRSNLDLQVLSEIFRTITISNRGPTFSSATIVVTSLLYSNNQTEDFINHFDFLFTQWSTGARDQEFTVVVPLLEILRGDVNHSLNNPKKFFSLANTFDAEKLGDFQSTIAVVRSFLEDFLKNFLEHDSIPALRFAKIVTDNSSLKDNIAQFRSIPPPILPQDFQNELSNGNLAQSWDFKTLKKERSPSNNNIITN